MADVHIFGLGLDSVLSHSYEYSDNSLIPMNLGVFFVGYALK